MAQSVLAFGRGSRKNVKELADKLEKFEAIENDLAGVAITELVHAINIETDIAFRLDDDESLKRVMKLKDNAAKSLLLLNRLSQYTLARRGVLPSELGRGSAPDAEAAAASKIVEEAMQKMIEDARFR